MQDPIMSATVDNAELFNSLVFKSDNETVAVMSEETKGTIVPVSNGTANIYAFTSKDNSWHRTVVTVQLV